MAAAHTFRLSKYFWKFVFFDSVHIYILISIFQKCIFTKMKKEIPTNGRRTYLPLVKIFSNCLKTFDVVQFPPLASLLEPPFCHEGTVFCCIHSDRWWRCDQSSNFCFVTNNKWKVNNSSVFAMLSILSDTPLEKVETKLFAMLVSNSQRTPKFATKAPQYRGQLWRWCSTWAGQRFSWPAVC